MTLSSNVTQKIYAMSEAHSHTFEAECAGIVMNADLYGWYQPTLARQDNTRKLNRFSMYLKAAATRELTRGES